MTESSREKEAEYKDIIDILSRAMADITVGNKDFTENVFRQSERLEQLSQLEDIRLIKRNLQQQVATLKTAVRDKQKKDTDMIDLLSEQVTVLKTELEVSQQASFRDGLTGMYNEQALNRYLKTLVKPGADAPSPFSLLVIDIDNYDKIVETYSAELGQRVIMAAGQECRNLFNRDEFVARYNKGTFVAVLPAIQRKAAVKKAKKLCRTIAAKRYQIDEALTGHTLSFTVSIGVSALKRGDTISTVTSRAIQALSSARRSGTNQVVSEKTIFLRFKKGDTVTLEDL
jgi:diguanylate cyclase